MKNQTPPDHFITEPSYRALVEAIALAARDDLDAPSAIMQALGEVGGIWPQSVQSEAEANRRA
ncbi:hypothetical protein NX862_14460 [Rhodobacter sp. KR11]|uniref:hypothetical protein n=1 Tax=Rhodobacter sp. KR11 TaxID=2974588 RepID=UPI002221D8E7|nr:hypothetical protein [Rhodobacter sp. KR11]MCW1919960.1 hypothetical protein [Rhodobacter sp. KR11]